MRNHLSQKFCSLLAILVLALSIFIPAFAENQAITVSADLYPVEQDGYYSTMEEVAVYLSAYGHLPSNFLTKSEAEARGWNSKKGNLDEVAPGCSIGGNHFGNYEGLVPSAKGRSWTECDINFDGNYRGAERIVFSSDGLIYYTDDHYGSFTQIEVITAKPAESISSPKVAKGELYTGMDEVAAYLYQYQELPINYITKDEAKELGWSNQKNNLAAVAPGFTIGGDTFQNREKLLPAKKGRIWYECDVNTKDGKRGKERIVFSSDGLIYYTGDNFKSFTQLY